MLFRSDDDFEQPPPRPDQFVYVAPPDFGGAPEPVRFSVAAEPEGPETGSNGPPTRGLWNRLLGWWRPSEEEERRQEIRHELERREQKQLRRRQRFFAAMIPELRKTGVRRVYCRYDGGNDEGFAWLDSVEMQDGERIAAAALPPRLRDARFFDRLRAARVLRQSNMIYDNPRFDIGSLPDPQKLDHIFRDLCNEWATMLVGEGFGTGEYSMYGAFTVDLETRAITDDRSADPIVENIRIAT